MYESGGYPTTKEGNVQKEVFEIAVAHGRIFIQNNQEYIFTELVSELESRIVSAKMQVQNFTTKGVATSGENATIAMRDLTNSVVVANRDLLKIITTSEKN